MKADLQPVEVRWVDSASQHGWHKPENIEGDDGVVEIKTIGYLSRCSRKVVQVVQSRHVGREGFRSFMADIITIPRQCVRKITPIRGLGD